MASTPCSRISRRALRPARCSRPPISTFPVAFARSSSRCKSRRKTRSHARGAPLVPAFHAALFGGDVHRVIVNIGGIANLTDIPPGGSVRGFDTGPGNVLLDLWHSKHIGDAFDRNGSWGRTGALDAALLSML